MTLGINKQSLSVSEVPGYRALIKSWKDNTKPPCCIICQYPLLVDNDEDSELYLGELLPLGRSHERITTTIHDGNYFASSSSPWE